MPSPIVSSGDVRRAPGWDDLGRPISLSPRPARTGRLTSLVRLAPYARPKLGIWLLMLASMIVSTLMGVAVPLVTQRMVDGPITDRNARGVWIMGCVVLTLGIGEALFWFFRRLLQAPTGLGIENGIRTQLYARMQSLPMAFHSRWSSGQLLSRIMGDLITIRQFVVFGLTMLVVNAVQILVVLVLLVRMYLPLGLVTMAAVVPAVWVCLANERRYTVISRRVQDLTGDLASVVEESAKAHRVTRSFGRQRWQFDAFDAQALQLRSAALDRVRNTSGFWTIMEVIPTITLITVLAIGAWATAHGHVSLGTLVAFITLTLSLVFPVAMMGFMLSLTQDAMTAADRVCEVFDAEMSLPDGSQRLDDPRGELVFTDVAFSFPDADSPVLHEVNLAIHPGETIALVGGTGSGKSTLTSLVPRLFDVTHGSVTIDGIDVRHLELTNLRSIVATAFEDPTLFSMSARENLTIGRPDATDEEVAEAIEVAQAGFVHDLPFGLDTRIGEQGMSLSGGQRQRLALARAVVSRPKILVLDDTLSALDIHTEALVEEALKRVLVGVTGIVVAHRASTVLLADRVALLQQGTITHVGTHAELLATVPEYRELLSADFDAEGELDELEDHR